MSARSPWRPTREQLEAARRKTVPDVIRPGLDILFVGITNVVARATARADELSKAELRRGARVLERKLFYKPRAAAFLGLGLYRDAFDRQRVGLGLQEETIGCTRLWVLPNPSGINAHFQVPDYARMFRELGQFLGRPVRRACGQLGSR